MPVVSERQHIDAIVVKTQQWSRNETRITDDNNNTSKHQKNLNAEDIDITQALKVCPVVSYCIVTIYNSLFIIDFLFG